MARSLLDLPAEVRAYIYQYIYGSLILHVCPISPSKHTATYPPDSECACIESALDTAQYDESPPIKITAYSRMSHIIASPSTDRAEDSPGDKGKREPEIILKCASPATSILAPLLINRKISSELDHLLQTAGVTFYAINLDAYSIHYAVGSAATSGPSWLRPQIVLASRLDINVRETTFKTSRAISNSYILASLPQRQPPPFPSPSLLFPVHGTVPVQRRTPVIASTSPWHFAHVQAHEALNRGLTLLSDRSIFTRTAEIRFLFWTRGLKAVQDDDRDGFADDATSSPSLFEISEMWVDRLVALQKTWAQNKMVLRARGSRNQEGVFGSIKLQVLKPACWIDPWQRIMTDDEWCGVERVKQVQMEAGGDPVAISDVLVGI